MTKSYQLRSSSRLGAPAAALQDTSSMAPASNMAQATLLELVDHISKLTEVVEKMSTNIVLLNEDLRMTTRKVDRILKRDVPNVASMTSKIGDSQKQSSPIQPPAARLRASPEVIDLTNDYPPAAANLKTTQVLPGHTNEMPNSSQPASISTSRLSMPPRKRSFSVSTELLSANTSYHNHNRTKSTFRLVPSGSLEKADDSAAQPPAKRARVGDDSSKSRMVKGKPSPDVPARASGKTKEKAKPCSNPKPKKTTSTAGSSRVADLVTHATLKNRPEGAAQEVEETTAVAENSTKKRRKRGSKSKRQVDAVGQAKKAATHVQACMKGQRLADL